MRFSHITHTLLLTVGTAAVLSPAFLPARTILTPQASADYTRRLTLQPELAGKLAIPSSASPEETEVLTFLYAYIPTPDVVDYDSVFYLENVRMALRAAEEMPWGKDVPDREWRHFVLPVRVNNEDLDLSRKVFYDELKQRVEGLPMKEAILEINHWCHEKVSYQPSDQRTSSPLVTVGNALGRCGEESTFTVAALRSVGIPARQVYTPRWAHTDDNHAWVEVWADGRWWFLGACEPEPVLNLAWFNAPAARGMMMTTKVPGVYDGPEEKLEERPISTVINVTENYAPTAQSTVYVMDADGRPVKGADVRFGLYNYAEFFPLTVKKTDADGKATVISGNGDLVVWAADKGNFNFSKLTAGDTLRLRLDKTRDFTGTIDFTLTPPPPGGNLPVVTPEQSALNDRRKAYEDSVRHAYENTFISADRAAEICRDLAIPDSCAQLLTDARGNHAVIEQFLRQTPAEYRNMGVTILQSLAEKDLHDVTTEVLEDTLYPVLNLADYGDVATDSEMFKEYVISPRIAFEKLRPFRTEIINSLTRAQIAQYSESPARIAADLNASIATDTIYNPDELYQSPTGTLRNRIANPMNKGLAFVAICRTLGIPARIDQVSHQVQYASAAGEWLNVDMNPAEDKATSTTTGTFHLEHRNDLNGRQPKYYSQFAMSHIEDGMPQLLEFDDFEPVKSINGRKESLAAGQYCLLSGQRLADGSVLARTEFFHIEPGKEVKVPLVVRQDTTALQVIGTLDAELLYTPIEFSPEGVKESGKRSILSTTGRGYYALGVILPGHEPSAHALNDIAEAADELTAADRKILLLFPDADAARRFRTADYDSLPECVVFGIDDDGSIMQAIREGLEIPESEKVTLPSFIVADSFNRIIYHKDGYTIRLGDTLAKILQSVK